jgi:hypothetical protein
VLPLALGRLLLSQSYRSPDASISLVGWSVLPRAIVKVKTEVKDQESVVD